MQIGLRGRVDQDSGRCDVAMIGGDTSFDERPPIIV
jgi:hypothetical protein